MAHAQSRPVSPSGSISGDVDMNGSRHSLEIDTACRFAMYAAQAMKP
jgi:hypothetical protein